jgi:ubiquinone/menaquinone biosynthesis C-methylase UbiE
MTREHYESAVAVKTVENWYSLHKEEAFFEYISSLNRVPRRGLLLEVGGGSGIHGKILAQMTKWLYVHSDYSYAMCRAAKEKGLDTIQSDGLALPVHDESLDAIFTVGVSTIIGSAPTRIDQFKEFYRVLRPGGDLTIVTARPIWKNGQHCIDRGDLEALLELGFTDPRVKLWGVIPGRWWTAGNSQKYRTIENAVSWARLGGRKVVMLKKKIGVQ